jgi:hypothetical protein
MPVIVDQQVQLVVVVGMSCRGTWAVPVKRVTECSGELVEGVLPEQTV